MEDRPLKIAVLDSANQTARDLLSVLDNLHYVENDTDLSGLDADLCLVTESDDVSRCVDAGIAVIALTDDPQVTADALRAGATDALPLAALTPTILERLIRYAEPLIRSEKPANAYLKKAQEIARLGSWEWNLATQEMVWSDEMYRIYGLDINSGKPTIDTFFQCIHDGDVSRVLETLLNGLDQGRITAVEFRVVRPNGEERFVLGEEEGIYDSEGKLVKLIGAVQDITERKMAEADRERLLTNLNRLATQMSTAAVISKSVITILDSQTLIEHTVNFIKESFNFYYVGMFLVDEAGQYAVLKAGTDDVGQRMIAEGHKLLIGGDSMIGQCIETSTALIAPDVEQASAHYDNPHLPDTRSELALPLIQRGLCLGALTVQDTVRYAFLDSDINALQTVVDQVAGAIENARLFEAAHHEIAERKQAEVALQISQDALQSKADSLITLNMIADTLHQSLDYQIVMDRALDILDEYTPARAVAIFDVDTEKNRIKMIVSHGLSPSMLKVSSGGNLNNTLAGEAARTRNIVTAHNIANEERIAPEIRAALTNDGIATVIIVPIVYQDRVLGILALGFEQGMILTPEKHETILAVARTICLAMANASYVDQIQHEIAERKHAQEEARRLNQELEQRVNERTLRLEAANRELEAFTYSVSHDLRAPLRIIEGYSQALIEDHGPELTAGAQDYLTRLRAASQRMDGLINDLLMLFRVSRFEIRRQPVNLTEIARVVVAELKEATPERQVEFVMQEDMQAQGDPRLMTIMLNNLLGNAWKFTSKQEHARIEFGHTEVDGKPTFFIRDDGAGFDMRYADRLFGAFQRLHKLTDFEGSGIGLATVQRIVQQHGGRIWAHGETDNGATFYFVFD